MSAGRWVRTGAGKGGEGNGAIRRRLLRLAAAAGVVILTLMSGPIGLGTAATGAATGAPASAGSTSGSTTSSSGLVLAGQSTTVSAGHAFSLELDVPAQARHDDRIVVSIYPALTTRTGFDNAAKGLVQGESPLYEEPEVLNTAPRTPAGAVVARIPVGMDASAKELPAWGPGTTQPGVYPLEVQLEAVSDGRLVGQPLSTFLVYSPAKTGFGKLAVSLTVPVNAPPSLTSGLVTTPPPSASAATLSTLVKTIASVPGVPITLDVTPQTVDALATGPPSDQATVTTLSNLAAQGDELAPSPYVSVSLAGLDAAGLDTQADNQLTAGASALLKDLQQAPDNHTWVIGEPLRTRTLQYLMGRGLKQLILPDADLSALPAALDPATYANKPASLNDGSAQPDPLVVGADTILSGRLGSTSDPVLAAEQILAEVAMIQLEYPGIKRRGVAIVAPVGQNIQPQLLSTLLAGLRDNPLVSPVTASGLFAELKVPAASSTTASPPSSSVTVAPTTTVATTGSTVAGGPSATALPVLRLMGRAASRVPAAVRINAMATKIDAIATVVPQDATLLARLRRQLLLTESDQIAAHQRRALLASSGGAIAGVESPIKLVGATSVTLTARNVHLPLTIQSAPKMTTHVQLVLTSGKLSFKAYVPPGGTCSQSPTIEICFLTLPSDQTTLKIPVLARTTGVFSLDIRLLSPNGNLVLASATDTVRSTAVSFAGWVLIFGAGILLAIWWIRDARNGRRARQLVSRPDDGDADEVDRAADLQPVPPRDRVGVSPSGRVGGHNQGGARRRNPEEIPT